MSMFFQTELINLHVPVSCQSASTTFVDNSQYYSNLGHNTLAFSLRYNTKLNRKGRKQIDILIKRSKNLANERSRYLHK